MSGAVLKTSFIEQLSEYARHELTVFDKDIDLGKLAETADRIAEIQHPPEIATVQQTVEGPCQR